MSAGRCVWRSRPRIIAPTTRGALTFLDPGARSRPIRAGRGSIATLKAEILASKGFWEFRKGLWTQRQSIRMYVYHATQRCIWVLHWATTFDSNALPRGLQSKRTRARMHPDRRSPVRPPSEELPARSHRGSRRTAVPIDDAGASNGYWRPSGGARALKVLLAKRRLQQPTEQKV